MIKKILVLSAAVFISGCANTSYLNAASADVVSTAVGLSRGASEMNPVLNKLGGGDPMGIVLAASGVKYLYYRAALKQAKPTCEAMIRAGKAGSVGAAVNNVAVIAGVPNEAALIMGLVAGITQYKRAHTHECKK